MPKESKTSLSVPEETIESIAYQLDHDYEEFIESFREDVEIHQPALSDLFAMVYQNAHYVPEYELGTAISYRAFDVQNMHEIAYRRVEAYQKYTQLLLTEEYEENYQQTVPDNIDGFDQRSFHADVMFLYGYHPTLYKMWYAAEIVPANKAFDTFAAKRVDLFSRGRNKELGIESANTFYRGIFDMIVPVATQKSRKDFSDFFSEFK